MTPSKCASGASSQRWVSVWNVLAAASLGVTGCVSGAPSEEPAKDDQNPSSPNGGGAGSSASDDDGEVSEVPTSNRVALTYGDCVEPSRTCAGGSNPHCLVDDERDVRMGFCTSECSSVEQCPLGPGGGTAPVRCLDMRDDSGAAASKCVLDCFLGASCPAGMVCLPYGVCGYVTEEAPDPYGSCGGCPEDSKCISTQAGSVCAPDCVAEGCPSPRSGALPDCATIDDNVVCSIPCDVFDPLRPCPSGMLCSVTGFSSLCVWEFDERDPCDDIQCGDDEVCRVDDGEPECECRDGFVGSEGGGCAPDVDRAYDVDDADDVDDVGGVDDVGCPGAHFDGDEHEPNECADAATLVAPGDSAIGLSLVVADISPSSDDIDFYRLMPNAGTYWILLDASREMCSLEMQSLPDSSEFGGFDFGVQLSSQAVEEPWSCSRVDEQDEQPSYSLGILRFPTAFDLPNVPQTVPTGTHEVNDTFDGEDDVDTFMFQSELPLTLVVTGQALNLDVQVRDDFGELLLELTRECAFSLDPTPCLELEGEGEALFSLSLRQSGNATQSELSAWRVSW